MARPENEDQAISWLVGEVPELRALLDEHLEFYEELLSYLVFADFTRWFADRVRAEDTPAARSYLGAVEPLLTTSVTPPAKDSVWNLAAVAFVEALGLDREVIARARPWMGPSTRKLIEADYGNE
jgi:hypothetical protein